MFDRELIHQFFLEAFPNPERKGCPKWGEVKRVALEGPKPDDPVLYHLSSCSECYSEYKNHRQDAKERVTGLLN